MTYDSRQDTLAHIARVQELIWDVQGNLKDRAEVHDASKLAPPEKEMFDRATEKLRGLDYGSDEYRKSLKELGPALEHHYAHNSHHPEHYRNGVDDMSLFDVVEMLIDWKAASERHATGDIWQSIEHNQKRFGMSDQLTAILRNTAREMGWEV